jgi:hypothetical protein
MGAVADGKTQKFIEDLLEGRRSLRFLLQACAFAIRRLILNPLD